LFPPKICTILIRPYEGGIEGHHHRSIKTHVGRQGSSPEVGKLSLKINTDEAFNDDCVQKRNADKALNNDFSKFTLKKMYP
jgi:hypothetical protein